jgi:hypothetical protein
MAAAWKFDLECVTTIRLLDPADVTDPTDEVVPVLAFCVREPNVSAPTLG